ncbi:receptor expression-enhancing protein 2-like isoform X5 [Saccostrea cucullata]|uniref:receptor expression-enhancing protein 2-like isoform X4 n=1 Tax=Saccostrea cuccullata TaxID=36930 RepID=UPI002ED3E032
MMSVKEVCYTCIALISPVFYVFCRLVFGLLYPAYASFKAIRTKNVKEYVKWMMYWIVFALFSAVETFTDVLLSWLPFYYEVKILFVVWMLLPVTKGSSYLYKKFVHPHLAKREKEIDDYIDQYSKKGYTTLLSLGSRGLTYATNVVVTTAIKGQSSLVDHIKKSYSTNDLRVGEDTVDGHHPSFMLDEDELDTELNPVSEASETSSQTSAQLSQKSPKVAPKVGGASEKGVDLQKPRKQGSSGLNSGKDERIAQDNREIERRKPLRRSTSDVTEVVRPPTSRYRNPATELSKVVEVEEEYSYHEESVHVRPGYYSPRQVKLDPYGTLPRTRARTRSKLPK